MGRTSKLYAELISGLPRTQLQADTAEAALAEIAADPKLRNKVARIVRITREEIWPKK